MTGGSEVRGATTTALGANWSITGQQVAVTGLSQLNLDNVPDNVETAFMTVDADGISVSADVANNAALVIGGALSASGVATNAVADMKIIGQLSQRVATLRQSFNRPDML